MKKFLIILLTVFCVLAPTLTLAQENTTIMTTVPSEHRITIVCGEHGQVVINGKIYSGTFNVQAVRLGTMVIKAQPDGGYVLSQITVSDSDGVTVKGDGVTLSGIHCENTVILTFHKLAIGTEASPTDMYQPTVTPAPVSGGSTLADTITLPEISAAENLLYDDFIGTGSGFGQLSIVYDGEYQPQDYELLNIKPLGEEQKNAVLVRAFPDENGETVCRSLMLSVVQLVKLAQKQQTEKLIFENGEAAVMVDLADILGGNVRELIGLIVKSNEEVSAEMLDHDWSSVQNEELTAEELAFVKVEIRMIPVEQADGNIAYDISVWLHWDDREWEISSMLPSMCVCLYVDDENSGQYAVGLQAENTKDFLHLDSIFVFIPEMMSENQPDEAEKFIVTIQEKNEGIPVIVYDASTLLSRERHSAVTAGYIGKGFYQLLKLQY